MTKLNWRDASKELPACDDDCIVIDYAGVKGVCFYVKMDAEWVASCPYVDERDIKYWIYLSELPSPEE